MLRRTALRQFSSLRRSQFLPRRYPQISQNGEPVEVHKVRFLKHPYFSWYRVKRRLFYTVTFTLFIFYVLPQVAPIGRYFEFAVEDNVALGEEQEEGEEEEEEEEEDEDGWFVPLHWPKKKPRSFYRASDPEWQRYVKFSRDPRRNADVQKRLVTSVREEFGQMYGTKRLCGEIDYKKGRFWLEVTFPDGPPQEYQVTGLEFATRYIALSTKDISQQEYHSMCRLLFPMPAIRASLASFRYQFDTQANKIRQYLGLPTRLDPEVVALRSILRAKITPEKFHKGASSAATGASGRPTPVSPSRQEPPADTSEGQEPITLALFVYKMKKYRENLTSEPPRGSIVVSGLIELVGPKARATVDVTAAYDPEQDVFLTSTSRFRGYQLRLQRPRGGQ